jgi:TusA-related sulfurtransferase
MNSEILPFFSLDVSNLCCPLPLIKAKALLSRFSSGQTLAVRNVHLLQIADFEDWCKRAGQSLESKSQVSTDHFNLLIKKN